MSKGKITLWVSVAVLILIGLFGVLVDRRMAIWLGGMLLLGVSILKNSRFKGISTILTWAASGFALYATLWLEPSGRISDGHLYALWLLVFALGFWERFRIERN